MAKDFASWIRFASPVKAKQCADRIGAHGAVNVTRGGDRKTTVYFYCENETDADRLAVLFPWRRSSKFELRLRM